MHAERIGVTEALTGLLVFSYFSVVFFFPIPPCLFFFHSILCFAFQIFTLFSFICVLYYLLFII